MAPRLRAPALAAIALAAFAGCDRSTDSPDMGPDGTGGGGHGDGATGGDGGDFCSGSGPVVTVGDGQTAQQLCTGQLAQAVFQNALCTCNNAQMAGYLLTRGMNSLNPKDPNDGGAAVGINNSYGVTVGFTDVGGSFSIAGMQSLTFIGYLAVRGDLRLAGEAFVPGYTKVVRDAWFGGNFTDIGPFDVGGDLHHAGAVAAIPLSVKGQNKMEKVQIAPPCDCSLKDLLDVGALVDAAKVSNDNATIGLAPSTLAAAVGLVDVTLPCGRFYLDRIGGLGAITVHVTGRVALFVDGDIAALGVLQFDLAPKAEIDIFVKGNLVLAGKGSFGDKSRPAATRIYVGGASDIVLVGAAGFVGNVYAPRANVTAVGYADVWGSVFANNFTSPGYAHIVYDRAILQAGQGCGGPPATCNLCGVCPNGLACVQGKCVDCTSDKDCCSQATCNNGFCGPLIP